MKVKALSAFIALSVLFTACSKKSEENPAPSGGDTTPPVITLKGSATVNQTQNTAYSDAGATATDNVDGTVAVTSNVTSTNPNVAVVGTYTITYTASDKAGNKATAKRTVNVVSSGGGSATRADYLWNPYPTTYYAAWDSCYETKKTFTYNGDILAGTGANDIMITYFIGFSQSLKATVNGSTFTIPSQSIYPYTITGSGSINSSKNVITINYNNGSENHISILTKK